MSKRLSRFEDFSAFQRFTGADYLADRNLVAYAADKILLRSLSDGTEEQVTVGGRGEGSPRFCPDGKNSCSYLPLRQGDRFISMIWNQNKPVR